MAIEDAKKSNKKRRLSFDDAAPVAALADNGELEMLSDEEGEEGAASDDGQVDEFPEIDTRSDSEDDVEGATADEEEDSDEEDEEDEQDDSDTDSDDSEHHIFPIAKNIVSDITGHPKRVYPEIEPDYDSDSSTEDVRFSILPHICTDVFLDS